MTRWFEEVLVLHDHDVVTDPAGGLKRNGLKVSARLRGLSWVLDPYRQRRARWRTTLSSVRPYWAGKLGELATLLSSWAHSSRSRTSGEAEEEPCWWGNGEEKELE